MMKNNECKICSILNLKKEILFQNELYCAIFDHDSLWQNQILIVSKNHDSELNLVTSSQFFAIQNEVLNFLSANLMPDGFNIGTTEYIEQNSHKNVKIIPRFFGDVDFTKTICLRFQSIYAPWRHNYVVKGKDKNTEGCVFCKNIEQIPGPENLVLGYSKNFAMVLNKYPYSQGHLMIIPKKHIQSVVQLSEEEFSENESMVELAKLVLNDAFRAAQFNVGYNLGAAGGAGIPKHLHRHVVPRYKDDQNYDPWHFQNNFMDLEADFYKLVSSFQKLSKSNNFGNKK